MENGDESFPAKLQVVALPHGKLQSCGFAVLTSFQGLKPVLRQKGWLGDNPGLESKARTTGATVVRWQTGTCALSPK